MLNFEVSKKTEDEDEFKIALDQALKNHHCELDGEVAQNEFLKLACLKS